MAEEKDLIAEAWDAVKEKDDAAYADCMVEHQLELQSRADGVRRTGKTVEDLNETGSTLGAKAKFEVKYKQLLDRQKADELADAENAEKADKPLASKTRAALDEIAVSKGLSPEDYPNKAPLIEAIEKQ